MMVVIAMILEVWAYFCHFENLGVFQSLWKLEDVSIILEVLEDILFVLEVWRYFDHFGTLRGTLDFFCCWYFDYFRGLEVF